MRFVRISILALIYAPLLVACEGTGSAGGGLVIEDREIDPACAPVPGTFPAGLTLLPGDPDRAVNEYDDLRTFGGG